MLTEARGQADCVAPVETSFGPRVLRRHDLPPVGLTFWRGSRHAVKMGEGTRKWKQVALSPQAGWAGDALGYLGAGSG